MREYARRYRERHRERILARERELYAKNPEKYREKSRRVRARRSPEHAKQLRRIQYYKHNEGAKQNKEYQREWRKRNSEHTREYQRQYAEANREHLRQRNKAYRLRNIDSIRISMRRSKVTRRAREFSAEGSFTSQDIKRLRQRQKGKCYWCKRAYGPSPHIDHVWPLVKGGSNGPENLVLSCPTCNVRKNAKTPLEFAGRLL